MSVLTERPSPTRSLTRSTQRESWMALVDVHTRIVDAEVREHLSAPDPEDDLLEEALLLIP